MSSDQVTGDSPSSGRNAVVRVRTRAAQLISLVCTVAAVLLAVGAILIALRANSNEGNAIVKFITGIDDAIDGLSLP